MQLITYRAAGGEEVLAVAAGGRALDAASLVPGGPASIEQLLNAGAHALAALRASAAPARTITPCASSHATGFVFKRLLTASRQPFFRSGSRTQ